jgi:hypothetical protein
MAVFRLNMYRGRTERKRKALHMLILSGVVRPSHTELRYTTLLSQAEEESNGSSNSAVSPAHASDYLHRFLSSLQRRITQLIPLGPTHWKHSLFKPRHAITSRMCLRTLSKSECESSLVPLP